EAREPAFLMGVVAARPGPGFGVGLLELSTGEFTATAYLGPEARQTLADELALLRPRENVAPAALEDVAAMSNELGFAALVTHADDWSFEHESARRALLDQLKTHSLQAFGLEDRAAATCAAGAL